MPQKDYDRYAILDNKDGSYLQTPFIDIPFNASDKYETWNEGYSRLDKLSQKYYGTPFYDFLILYANKIYVSEFEIPTGASIRIPFPLQKAKGDYERLLNLYRNGL